MLRSRARRIPLIDIDDETKQEMVVSVLTQFRILKFIAINVQKTQVLRKPLRELMIVTEIKDMATANMDTPVMNVIHMLVQNDISSVPIVDPNGTYAQSTLNSSENNCNGNRDPAQHLRIGRHPNSDQGGFLPRTCADGRGSPSPETRRKSSPVRIA